MVSQEVKLAGHRPGHPGNAISFYIVPLTPAYNAGLVGHVPVKKGDGVIIMMKIGDRFKDKTTGKIYIIRMELGKDTLFLEGENGLGRRLTGKESLKRTCEKLEGITS
jgi:hypothetical protein